MLVDRLIETEEKQRRGGSSAVKEEEQAGQGGQGGAQARRGGGVDLKSRLRSSSTNGTMELEHDSDMLEALGEIIIDLDPSSV